MTGDMGTSADPCLNEFWAVLRSKLYGLLCIDDIYRPRNLYLAFLSVLTDFQIYRDE